MELIWHGTACIEAVGQAGRLLFDPFVPLEGSAVDVRLEDFDGFSDALVTHGHFDHISSIPAISARNPGMQVWCTQTPYRTLKGKGVDEDALHLLDYGVSFELAGFTIRTYHGRHAVLPRASVRRVSYALRSSARRNLPWIIRENSVCHENGETVLYLIEEECRRVAIMGSLNLCDDVDYPSGVDVLVLPYNGWEDNLEPAVRAIERLQPARVLLDHYDDTFPPLTMPLDFEPILRRYPGVVEALELGKRVQV